MRSKRIRTPAVPGPTPDDDHPPDATGLTIDWIGVQETAGGGLILPVWLVGALAAIRAAPFVAWRVSRRLAASGRRGRRRREPEQRP